MVADREESGRERPARVVLRYYAGDQLEFEREYDNGDRWCFWPLEESLTKPAGRVEISAL